MSSGRQIIKAEGGFAYGAVDGDVHLVAPRGAGYAIRPWTPSTVHPSGAPPRPRRWRDGPHPLALHWLHGGSSLARTSSRDSIATESARASWSVRSVTRRIPGDPMPSGDAGEDVPGTAVDRLFLIDDAHDWELRALTWLLSNALFQRAGVRTRVLLVAEDQHGWPGLRSSVAWLQPSLSTEAVAAAASE